MSEFAFYGVLKMHEAEKKDGKEDDEERNAREEGRIWQEAAAAEFPVPFFLFFLPFHNGISISGCFG